MAADDWIKMRVHLRDDPGTVMIQARTGLDLDTIIGKLHRFWSWADAHVSEGRRCARCAQKCAPCERCQKGSDDGFAQGIAKEWVDAYLDHPGFAAALVDAGWARFNAQGIVLPRYTSNNGSTGKGRAQAAKRQAKRRCASRSRNDHVTPERYTSVTRGEERRGEERRGEKESPSETPPNPHEKQPSFLAFWHAYPAAKRTQMNRALGAWSEAMDEGADPDHIVAQAKRYAESDQGRSKFAVTAPRFLSDRMFNDPPEAWSDDQPPSDGSTATGLTPAQLAALGGDDE